MAVMVALFMVEVALGLVARTSPQIHIMEFGFPIKISVGFFFIGLIRILRQLNGDLEGAREDWESVIQSAPDSAAADLAQQNLALSEAGPKRR